jgi:L-alanine-DL-glutamate epimerase-like enolase superfamily enzyme
MGDTVERIDLLHCDAGWRNYHFCKVTTGDGVEGWSEYDEGFSAPAVSPAIEALAPLVVGRRAADHEAVHHVLRAATRPASTGVVGEAIGAIENALLDAKARALGVPCYELLGGKIRDRIRVYWSHSVTWRVSFHEFYGGPIETWDDVRNLGAEVRAAGFTALKTNIFTSVDGERLRGWAPGFGRPADTALNVERQVLRDLHTQLTALRDGAGDDVDILLDLNFNARPGGLVQIVRAIADLDLFWIEIDADRPAALASVRQSSAAPISGCETIFGVTGLLPYLEAQAVDVAIIDGVWNGMWQAMKMASTAAGFDVNVAPHNFYGHLATMMNAHFAAAVPNLRIMETDIDRLPWDDELVTVAPQFEDGHLVLGDAPGWGTEPVEEAIAARPPGTPRLLSQRKR